MGMRRERGSSGEEDIDSLGIAITVPFGGGNYISAKSSAARLAATEAEVRVMQTHRELQQQLHEVEHQLESTRRSLELGKERQALHRQHWQMAKKAFSLGETDILPAIQALRRYRESRLQYQLTELDQQRLVSEFNQTVGVLP
jgi:outer membrane protein TolC